MPTRLTHWASVLAASLLAGAIALFLVLQDRRDDARLELTAIQSEMELAMATLSVRMASMATALERSPRITPDLYRQIYADVTRPAMRVPERAMAFMPELPDRSALDAIRRDFEDGHAAADYPPFRLFPDGPAAALFPVVLVEPEPSRPNVFGFNLGSNAERLSAARRALDSGQITASAPVELSQDRGQGTTSFLVTYPVDMTGHGGDLPFQRGVVAAGMTPEALLAGRVALHPRHIVDLQVTIEGVAVPITLANSAAGLGPRIPLLGTTTLPVITTGGIDIATLARVGYVPGLRDVTLPLLAFAAAMVIGTLIATILNGRQAARSALEAALAAREEELREAYRIQSRSKRVQALGRLVGGVAHDFNNILSVILGNLELMLDAPTPEEREKFRTEAERASLRGAHLTRKLLAVGRKSSLRAEVLEVSQILSDSAAMLSRVLPASIQLTTASAAGLWRIEADPDGVQNALLNLAINARDAMAGRGKLIVEAANVRIGHDYLDGRPDIEFPPGRYVAISVTDTGAGMSPDVVDRAFEPFYTTKHATDGSGLGLPSVLGFCQQSGGTCRIYSEPGVGTTVRMFLPATQAAAPDTQDGTPPGGPQGSATILLAEDEEKVAAVICQHLRGAGYTVRHVTTGDAAWTLLERGEAYELLITDLVMPGRIQGAELARRAEGARPGMALLLMSGYPQEAAIEGNGVATRHPVLTKPVPRHDLLRMVARLLKA